MRWLVTGAGGMLGTEVVGLLRAQGDPVYGPPRAELDIRDPEETARVVRAHRPEVVINCAGWTAVDDAEEHEEEALAVNGHAVRGLAAACAGSGARLIQVSTDYVFDGKGGRPYEVDDQVNPVNAYGRTKLAGETAALEQGGLVVRTAWLYGAYGPNFVKTMIGLESRRDTVSVVDDQLGQPTWTADLADRLVRLARSGAPAGIYHGTNAGQVSWYGFAREIFALLGTDPDRVRPVGSVDFPRPAARPACSVLGHGDWERAGLAPPRDWREALHAAWPHLVGGA
jgi:dTDP-4-dehydrorhamnose reductase